LYDKKERNRHHITTLKIYRDWSWPGSGHGHSHGHELVLKIDHDRDRDSRWSRRPLTTTFTKSKLIFLALQCQWEIDPMYYSKIGLWIWFIHENYSFSPLFYFVSLDAEQLDSTCCIHIRTFLFTPKESTLIKQIAKKMLTVREWIIHLNLRSKMDDSRE